MAATVDDNIRMGREDQEQDNQADLHLIWRLGDNRMVHLRVGFVLC